MKNLIKNIILEQIEDNKEKKLFNLFLRRILTTKFLIAQEFLSPVESFYEEKEVNPFAIGYMVHNNQILVDVFFPSLFPSGYEKDGCIEFCGETVDDRDGNDVDISGPTVGRLYRVAESYGLKNLVFDIGIATEMKFKNKKYTFIYARDFQ